MSSCAASGTLRGGVSQQGSEVQYNPLARRAAGLTCSTEDDDDDDDDEPISRSAAALRAYYSRKRYSNQQAREFMRQQRVIHEFRSERDARERVAAEMSSIRRSIEREEAMRSAGRGDNGDAARSNDAERVPEPMLAGNSMPDGTRQGSCAATDPWAAHETAWLHFDAGPPDIITVDNFPWPPDAAQLLHATAAAIVRDRSCDGRDAHRAAFRRLALRWHPDKWFAKWGSRLQPGPPGHSVVARAQEVAQAITDAYTAACE